MRRSALAASVAALTFAGCAPRVVPSAAAPAVDAEDVCPTQDVYGYTVQRGEAAGTNAAQAVAAARHQATRALVDRACRGLSELRCAAVARHVKPWRTGHYDARTRSACASVSLQRDLLDTLARDAAVLESELRALASAAVDRAGGAPLAIPAPTWASGCGAGEIGQVVQAGLFNQIASFPSARVVDADTSVDGAARLVSQLAPGVGGVTLTAWLQRADDATLTPLPGFGFPLDLFEIAATEVGSCRSDRDLGLARGERLGAGGLRVRVEVPGVDGVGCEGKSVEPVVRVSRPSEVQVYSVAADGRSLLVWPPPGVLSRVEHTLSLGEMRLVAQPAKGDERLVAVALPEGAAWGATDGWRGFCESPTGLGPELYPDDAAIGSTTFTILPSGQGDCLAAPDVAALRDAVSVPPACR